MIVIGDHAYRAEMTTLLCGNRVPWFLIGVVCSVRVILGAACLLSFLLSDNALSIGAG